MKWGKWALFFSLELFGALLFRTGYWQRLGRCPRQLVIVSNVSPRALLSVCVAQMIRIPLDSSKIALSPCDTCWGSVDPQKLWFVPCSQVYLDKKGSLFQHSVLARRFPLHSKPLKTTIHKSPCTSLLGKLTNWTESFLCRCCISCKKIPPEVFDEVVMRSQCARTSADCGESLRLNALLFLHVRFSSH